MKESLKEKIEEKVGLIKTSRILDEQGSTSEVYRIETVQGLFLLKSSFKSRYRMWLAEEAKVLEKFNQEKQLPIPHFHGFIEEKDSSHLIMSFEKGITLTTALKKAVSSNEKKTLMESFGQFIHDFHEDESVCTLGQENDWLENQLAKAQIYVNNRQTSGSQELLNHLKTQKPLPVKATIIHGDCTPDNVLVLDGKVKQFIDVNGMTIGDPRYDISLAIRKFLDDPQVIDSFYKGYTRYKISEAELNYFDKGLYEFF